MISLVAITVAMCSHEMFVSIANICILICIVLLPTITIALSTCLPLEHSYHLYSFPHVILGGSQCEYYCSSRPFLIMGLVASVHVVLSVQVLVSICFSLPNQKPGCKAHALSFFQICKSGANED